MKDTNSCAKVRSLGEGLLVVARPSLRQEGFYVIAVPSSRRREKPSAIRLFEAAFTFAHVLILPIADRLSSEWPKALIENTKLMIID